MKQFICFFSGLLLLFVSTTRVVAQEVSDYSQLSEEELQKAGIKKTTVRLSIGLENSDDLIADLKQAIES